MKKIICLLTLGSLIYSCAPTKHINVDACPIWADNIHNPDNQEFVVEVAFNLGIPVERVTQGMFNQRYVDTQVR